MLARILAAALALLLGAPAAAARPSRQERPLIVVLPFRGPAAARARAAFLRRLRRSVRLLPVRRFRREAAAAGVPPASRRAAVEVCRKLRCAAVVTGTVRRAKRRLVLTVAVRDASSGEVLGRRSARARRRRGLLRVAVPAVARRALILIRRAEPPALAPPPTRVVVAPPPPKPRPRRRPRRRRAKSLRGLLSATVGFGIAQRRFQQDGRTRYDGGIYPEVTLALEVYPLVPVTRAFPRYLGIGLSFSHHLKISTQVPGPPAVDVDTTSRSFDVDLRLRWPVLRGAASPVVLGRFGFGLRDFDLGANAILTSFGYRYLYIAAGGRVPLGTPYVAVTAEADIRPILAVGDEAIASYGERDGGLGWSVRAGLSGRAPFGLVYFARFEFLSLASDFAGLQPANPTPPGGRPAVRGRQTEGRDRYIRFWAGAGYAF